MENTGLEKNRILRLYALKRIAKRDPEFEKCFRLSAQHGKLGFSKELKSKLEESVAQELKAFENKKIEYDKGDIVVKDRYGEKDTIIDKEGRLIIEPLVSRENFHGYFECLREDFDDFYRGISRKANFYKSHIVENLMKTKIARRLVHH